MFLQLLQLQRLHILKLGRQVTAALSPASLPPIHRGWPTFLFLWRVR
jgi:hypothetical protein